MAEGTLAAIGSSHLAARESLETLYKTDTVSPRPGSIAASSFLSPGVTKSIAGLHCPPAEGRNNNRGPGPTRKVQLCSVSLVCGNRGGGSVKGV